MKWSSENFAHRCTYLVNLNDDYLFWYFSFDLNILYLGKVFAFAGGSKQEVLTCSSTGGVIYEVVEESNGDKKLEKVLGLKGHRRHATCTDWSVNADCGPCVTAGFDGQIRISTLLSQ